MRQDELSGTERLRTGQLEAARETGSGPPVYRSHQEMAAAQITLALKDLSNGQTRSTLPIPGYQDSITLRLAL